MLPLPVPQCDGSIMALQSLVNLDSYDDFILIIAWLLPALRPAGPYPLVALAGEQSALTASITLYPQSLGYLAIGTRIETSSSTRRIGSSLVG
jgi:hypothetical protein